MEEQQPVYNTTPGSPLKPKRAGKKRLLAIALIVVLVGGLLALGFLYMQQRTRLSERSREITTLRERIGVLEEEATASLPPVDEGESPGATCVGGSNYTAEIGRFSVTLDSPRVVVRKLDAGFEGGPITSLQIGSCLTGAVNVVDMYPTSEVNVTAHPVSTAADLKSQYESRSGAPLTAAGTTVIAGATAQRYTIDGLFSSTLLYFDHGGIGYEIELVDTSTATNATLSDLISDWAFTP